MSLAEVQSRTAEIHARIQSLAGTAPTSVVAALREAPATDPFADLLAQATGGAGPSESSDTGQQAVDLAKQFVGTPYKWGGTQPGGFDCSGLVQYVYKQLGIDLPRVSTDQAKAGTAVSPADAQPGDLVFFERGKVDHIGIYAGNGTWVEAPRTGDVVKIAPVDLSKAAAIRRVTGTSTATPSYGSGSAAWAGALPAAGQKYAGLIQQAASAAGVDPALLAAVSWTESGFNASATSSAGAQGLMQLMPRTAAGLGVDATDPAQALAGGAKYLAAQLDAFGGNTSLALAAYNAGPSAVRKYSGVPPYAETQAYVQKVQSRYNTLVGAAA
jgi:cell wall-associated NlpC family hydrolase